TINLPTPPATGAATSSAVNVVVGGNTLSVKPTESGSVVKTATVKVNGADTTVLNVTAGTAQVTASAANQPLVSVGSGANAVVISSGSASATVIASVDKTSGATSLTLPKATTGNDADASVKMTIGGQDVNVKPQGGDVVVTLKTVTVGGQDVQVVSVTGGSAMLTSSQPNQPLLAIGSGSNAIVVTGGSPGSEAISQVDSATGNTILSITSGTITLPSNAFAEAGTNGFSAIKDGKLYAGEIAVFNSAGKIAGVRLGSQSGTAANVGDPVKAASAAGLTSKVTVPNLKGKVARVSDTQDFGGVIAASLGAGYTAKGQNSSGVLSLTFPGGGSANAMPIGDITVDTNRADGVTVTGNGKVEVVKSGVIASFVPAVADPAQLTGQVIALDKNASVTVNEYGVLQVTVNGITYALQPGWVVSKANGGATGFTTDGQGHVVYRDGTGNQQTLYPAFADLAQLVATFKSNDANLGATSNDDGSVTAKYLGKAYTLTPDYALTPVPSEHAKDAWWLGADGKVYVKNADGKAAQGFTVK
ncbi:MAG: hypothetical protein K8F27_04705, partial [Sulfuricellaceae bacterium]|nr:hypothetical protein [Sulfuricellaceae bacterium]